MSLPPPRLKTAASATALGFPEAAIEPARARMAVGTAGDSASAAALARLDQAVRELKAASIEPMLQNAVAAIRNEDAKAAGEWAIKALEMDEKNGVGWYLLAIAREKAGDFANSVRAYEMALGLLPDQAEIANDMGRLAYRMGMKETAEKLFAHYLRRYPQSYEAANNLACAIRDQNRFDEAVEVLKPAIMGKPDDPLLWNTLGSVIAEQSDPEGAITFFNEALRWDPGFVKARYNRGNALLAIGQMEGALADCQAALDAAIIPSERMMMQLARSTIRICLGDLGGGWDDYEARLDPQFADVTNFMCDQPRWEPGSDLAGKRLVIIGEQGLGDEVLFANLIPDVLADLGPEGRLAIAVEPRLVSLFQRAFPTAEVGPHATYRIDGHTVRGAPFLADPDAFDLWTPLASLLRGYRRSVEAYPDRERFMRADPERVAYWKGVLAEAPAGAKVGILWKSLVSTGARHRFFAPFEEWEAVLKTPGITFVNLQYGVSDEEVAFAAAEWGVNIWTPPGIDLKDDLDDLAALTCALDLVLAPSNATSNIAAACGAPVWIISVPGAWSRLGTERLPWYPQARVFLPPGFGDWLPVMDEIAQALTQAFPTGT
ncbi:Flp pilus assembly protein TadD [Caulobacter ginsengisoli]|uniref:Flp pilus assembly protein TadD n=1 Tax=Caulobacter ginsengisoli TaxID=400775 RepID=A0ABU0ISB8_9CAUL|nr:tetratricopeptide repeat protein [Caulobacter ginsengisoli]MDQ0463919.1 Flp pilus assembly protein TadD [Caulobacter ginsengisoli]